MSITQNVGGVLHNLKEITVNDGGVLRSLKEITECKGGVLRKIYSKASSEGLAWELTGEDSDASIISVSDDGYTVKFYSGKSSTNTSIITDYITLNAGDTISRTASVSTSGTSKHCVLKIFDESGNNVKNIQSESYTIETAGKYKLGLTAFGATGTQTGTSYYSATATATITIA